MFPVKTVSLHFYKITKRVRIRFQDFNKKKFINNFNTLYEI